MRKDLEEATGEDCSKRHPGGQAANAKASGQQA